MPVLVKEHVHHPQVHERGTQKYVPVRHRGAGFVGEQSPRSPTARTRVGVACASNPATSAARVVQMSSGEPSSSWCWSRSRPRVLWRVTVGLLPKGPGSVLCESAIAAVSRRSCSAVS